MNSSIRADINVCEPEDIPAFNGNLSNSDASYLWYIWGEKTPSTEFLDYVMDELTLVENKTFIRSGIYLFKN